MLLSSLSRPVSRSEKWRLTLPEGILTEGTVGFNSSLFVLPCEAPKTCLLTDERFLASQGLLAELMCLCCTELASCRNHYSGERYYAFVSKNLPRLSISYAGNMVGVALTTEGECGLDMGSAPPGFHHRIRSNTHFLP